MVHRFQEKFLNYQPSTLIIFLNVGRYSEKSGNSMRHTTFIGEYYDRELKRYMACHCPLLVYSFKNSKCFYYDLLGWSEPIFIDSYIKELILLLKNEAVLTDIVECHYNDTNIHFRQVQKHKCKQGKCALYFQSQVCGNSCSTSVVVCRCLAAYDHKLFERFCSFQGIRQSADLSRIKYLKNISHYGMFLRVVLMKWFIENNIDIFVLLVRNVKSDHTELHKTIPTEKGEKGNSSSLRCKGVLSSSNNKQASKKIKPKSFDMNLTVVPTPVISVNLIFHLH